MPEQVKKKPHWFRLLKAVLRVFVIMLVIYGLARFVRTAVQELQQEQDQLVEGLNDIDRQLEDLGNKAGSQAEISRLREERRKMQRQRFSIGQLGLGWLVLAASLYGVGMIPSWVYWHWSLQALGQKPTWRRSMYAFFIGHLGKYAPGKALVVIIRTRLVSGPEVDATVAAVCVFVETLTTMAVGATVAATILLFYAEHWSLMLIAIGLVAVSGLPTVPAIFRALVRLVGVAERTNPEIIGLLNGLRFRLLATGWVMITASWFVFGLSLWATLKSVPGDRPIGLDQLMLLTACVAMAMVAGFVSLIPGGAGIRELVVTSLLASPFGAVVAISGAMLFRLTCLVSELVISVILYVGGRVVPGARAVPRKS